MMDPRALAQRLQQPRPAAMGGGSSMMGNRPDMMSRPTGTAVGRSFPGQGMSHAAQPALDRAAAFQRFAPQMPQGMQKWMPPMPMTMIPSQAQAPMQPQAQAPVASGLPVTPKPIQARPWWR